jgi:hypothetical protein
MPFPPELLILPFFALAISFDLISLVYTGLAIRTLWRLAHRWRALLDEAYTHDDAALAGDLGFFVLTPFGVLAHELAHLVTAQVFGARETSLNFRIYWGSVSYRPDLSPFGEFAVAAAGPAASLLLGLGALLLALRPPRPWSDILQGFGLATLALVLLFYPALSYWWGFGDFRVIYGTSPTLSLLAAGVHAAGLAVFAAAAGRLTSRDRSEQWATLAAGYPDCFCDFANEDAARLRALERSWTRFLPGVRQELAGLRELRDWIDEHNRRVERDRRGDEQPASTFHAPSEPRYRPMGNVSDGRSPVQAWRPRLDQDGPPAGESLRWTDRRRDGALRE